MTKMLCDIREHLQSARIGLTWSYQHDRCTKGVWCRLIYNNNCH